MRFSRVIFVGPGLSILLFLVALGIAGCPEPQRIVKVDCVRSIYVSSTTGVVAEHQAVYVCSGDKVTWKVKADKDVRSFAIKFKDACPFETCADINDAHPTGTVPNAKSYPKYLTLYEYTITVNDKKFDPHVVGGGGHGPSK